MQALNKPRENQLKPAANSPFRAQNGLPAPEWKTGSEAVGKVSPTGLEVLSDGNTVLKKRNMETVFSEHDQQKHAKQHLFADGTPIAFIPTRQTRLENAESGKV